MLGEKTVADPLVLEWFQSVWRTWQQNMQSMNELHLKYESLPVWGYWSGLVCPGSTVDQVTLPAWLLHNLPSWASVSTMAHCEVFRHVSCQLWIQLSPPFVISGGQGLAVAYDCFLWWRNVGLSSGGSQAYLPIPGSSFCERAILGWGALHKLSSYYSSKCFSLCFFLVLTFFGLPNPSITNALSILRSFCTKEKQIAQKGLLYCHRPGANHHSSTEGCWFTPTPEMALNLSAVCLFLGGTNSFLRSRVSQTITVTTAGSVICHWVVHIWWPT